MNKIKTKKGKTREKNQKEEKKKRKSVNGSIVFCLLYVTVAILQSYM